MVLSDPLAIFISGTSFITVYFEMTTSVSFLLLRCFEAHLELPLYMLSILFFSFCIFGYINCV